MREMETLGSELKRSQDALAESREEVSDACDDVFYVFLCV